MIENFISISRQYFLHAKLIDTCNHIILLFFFHSIVQRNGQYTVRILFRNRKTASFDTKILIRLRQMRRNRVMNCCFNLFCLQIMNQFLAILTFYNKLMPYMRCSLKNIRQFNGRIADLMQISVTYLFSLLLKLFYMLKFHS